MDEDRLLEVAVAEFRRLRCLRDASYEERFEARHSIRRMMSELGLAGRFNASVVAKGMMDDA